MYRILGGDGREYGPVTVDQIRQWIAEGRANAKTLVRVETSNEWKPLGSFPELSNVQLSGKPNDLSSQILSAAFAVRIADCLTRGWSLLKNNFRPVAAATFLVWLISTVTGLIPICGGILSLVINGVLYAGLYAFFLKLIRAQAHQIRDVFLGFQVAFAQLALGGIVTQVLTSLGWLFCLLPGLYLLVAWIFVLPLIVDKRLNFWPAMELSRRVVTRVWFQLLGLTVVAYLPMLLFFIYSHSQMAKSVFSLLVGGNLFDATRLSRLAKLSFSLNLYSHLILLFNLPFGCAVLMYAYDDIFQQKPASTT